MISGHNIINKLSFALFSIIMLTSCGGGGDNGGGEEKTPQPSVLVFPLENSECNEGTIVSDSQSRVAFEWNEATDADSYTLVITNLLDNTTRNINANGTSKEELILRGTPYSWYVISKANGSSKTANSPTWKFYNAGVAVQNYAPFPAELVGPAMGGLASTSTTLKWNGSDIDNDIESYDVYLGTANPPTTLLQNTTNTSLGTGTLNADTIYYWSVTSKDAHGNNSQSQVFEFRTQ